MLVLLGGALGSGARYLVSVWLLERFGGGFPWGTLTVNVIGSFLIGVIATLADERAVIGPSARVFLIVGVLGGFTTFSSFSLETLRLLEDRGAGVAVLNVIGNGTLSLGAAGFGIVAARSFD
ncbi:MAG: fluoride efflux transporter CrcB [Dehalococcoidia bacterium]